MRRIFGIVPFSFLLMGSLLTVAPVNALAKHPKTFPLTLKVDFGPAGKPYHEETLIVEKGTTAKEAVSQVFPILSGKACCSLREVIAIGGVEIDPEKNRWWTAAINGSRKIDPRKKKLKSGDVLEWKYIQDEQ